MYGDIGRPVSTLSPQERNHSAPPLIYIEPRSGDAFPDPLHYPLRKAQDVQDYAYKVPSNCVVGLHQKSEFLGVCLLWFE